MHNVMIEILGSVVSIVGKRVVGRTFSLPKVIRHDSILKQVKRFQAEVNKFFGDLRLFL
jgi:hypothetical protein